MKKSLIEVTLTSIISLVVLIILLGLANLVPLSNTYAVKVLEFVNLHVLTIILFILFFFLGELFFLFGFPLNIPGPIFYAYGGYFLVSFIFNVFDLVNALHPFEFFYQIEYIEPTINVLVIAIILIIGFSKILISKKKKEETPKPEEDEIEWKDVGKELKLASHNIVSKLNQKTKPEKTEELKKTKKITKKKKK